MIHRDKFAGDSHGRDATADIAVPAELRLIEANEIDVAYRNNPLLKENWAQAAWTFLTHCEGEIFKAMGTHSRSRRMMPDVVINLAKWPMRWIWKSCPPASMVDRSLVSWRSTAARDLYELAYRYCQYETVFSHASRGHWQIRPKRNRIVVTARDERSVRWDAYDRVVDAIDERDLPSECRPPDASEIGALCPEVRVDGRRFSYSVRNDVIDRVAKTLKPLLDLHFRLPSNWKLGRFTLREYSGVLRTLSVVSTLHLLARPHAIQQGVQDSGYSDGLVVIERRQLIDTLAHGASLNRAVVREIVQELTFGGREMKQPDIALQPLVALTGSLLCWAPSIVSSLALERNLITLLNRFPESRKAYARFSGQREGLLRDKLKLAFDGIGVRCWNGDVSGWDRRRDVDLVAIDDGSKQCLVMELKSFLGPADPPEMDNRSKELNRGIQQIRERRRLATEQRSKLDQVLGIDHQYSLTFLVVSEAWAGSGLVIDEEVPILRSSDLIRKIRTTRDLAAIASWAKNRDFLPVSGLHYRAVRDRAKIGKRVLEWYRIDLGTAFMEQSSKVESTGRRERDAR